MVMLNSFRLSMCILGDVRRGVIADNLCCSFCKGLREQMKMEMNDITSKHHHGKVRECNLTFNQVTYMGVGLT